ncbi:hypothetical protein FNV43_RR00497 [Rhamnella rubrinervis]|uniref:Uncharacterized protein n=1 Tax=Rhamnella rubrinervis TaxID=2594499 RepID=A0A8K0MSG5_9ROSA|nr:hypothetical protein FNV43_RR00497 [Rhamnella rubrinervis]
MMVPPCGPMLFLAEPPNRPLAQLARHFQASPLGLQPPSHRAKVTREYYQHYGSVTETFSNALRYIGKIKHPSDSRLSSDSDPLASKGFSNSYLVPTMESPGSDLVVEEQLVRKNSSRGASSSSGTPRPRQADDPNVRTPIRTPSIRIDGPGGNRSGLIIMRPVIIKNDIPSVFKQSDMSYHKERFDLPSQIKLSAPEPLERADSPRDGWICLWRYLLGLIVQSEKCGLQIDMATFLYFFYMKPSEEGRYTLYARRQIRLFEDAPTSDKGWKDRYFFVKREGLCDPLTLNRNPLTDRKSLESQRKAQDHRRTKERDSGTLQD